MKIFIICSKQFYGEIESIISHGNTSGDFDIENIAVSVKNLVLGSQSDLIYIGNLYKDDYSYKYRVNDLIVILNNEEKAGKLKLLLIESIIIFIITIYFISVIIYLIICIKNDIKPISLLLKILNILIIVEFYYLIGPIINISLISFVCENGNHIYLEASCFKGISHVLAFLASIVCILFHLVFSLIIIIILLILFK